MPSLPYIFLLSRPAQGQVFPQHDRFSYPILEQRISHQWWSESRPPTDVFLSPGTCIDASHENSTSPRGIYLLRAQITMCISYMCDLKARRPSSRWYRRSLWGDACCVGSKRGHQATDVLLTAEILRYVTAHLISSQRISRSHCFERGLSESIDTTSAVRLDSRHQCFPMRL